MGTKAYIIIKIDDNDLNKKCRFDPSKMAYPVQIHPNQKSGLPEITLTGKYLYSFHLLDSFPDALGKELIKNYDTYKKALNLVSGGIYNTLLGIYTYDDCKLPKGEYCVRNSLSWPAYIWDSNKPIDCDDFVALEEEMTRSIMSYAYLFENGRWLYKNTQHKKWKILR